MSDWNNTGTVWRNGRLKSSHALRGLFVAAISAQIHICLAVNFPVMFLKALLTDCQMLSYTVCLQSPKKGTSDP